MMREIFDDEHAVGFALDLHAAAHALERGERLFDGLAFHAAAIGKAMAASASSTLWRPATGMRMRVTSLPR